MEYILTGHSIVKTFGTGAEKTLVLSGVTVGIAPGEFVAVMGPSGSGKSTLLFALSGMDRIDSGRVVFDGQELSELSDNALADLRRTGMGFVFQQPTMLKNLSILDNILLPALRGQRSSAGTVDRAKLLMEQTGIAGLEERDVTQVSGGQLQRAGICRALMGSPKILFGDEPTGALNSQSAQEIMDILSAINAGGTAVLLVTHDAKVAARAGRILFMRDGDIVSEMLLAKDADLGERTLAVAEKMRQAGI